MVQNCRTIPLKLIITKKFEKNETLSTVSLVCLWMIFQRVIGTLYVKKSGRLNSALLVWLKICKGGFMKTFEHFLQNLGVEKKWFLHICPKIIIPIKGGISKFLVTCIKAMVGKKLFFLWKKTFKTVFFLIPDNCSWKQRMKNWFSENEKIISSFNHHSDIFGKKQVSQIILQESVPQMECTKPIFIKVGKVSPYKVKFSPRTCHVLSEKKTSK